MDINLLAIMERNDLDRIELGKELFPGTKYPSIAITRIIDKKALLNSEQLAKLAHLLGVTVDDLYSSGGWKNKPSKTGDIIFESGNYRAELDTETWITKVYHKDSLFHESIIHNGHTPINEYLENINNLILNNKSNVKH